MLYNPMNGVSGKARLRQKDGKTEVYLQLASGESAILKTFTEVDVQAPEWKYQTAARGAVELFRLMEPAVCGKRSCGT